jgi:SAM-dependent methyltransferase
VSGPLEELPFDQYQRYGALRLAAEWLRARLGRRLAILDVGAWNGLAARFCPEDMTVWLDPSGQGTGRYVQADGARLPFGDGSFDLVACLDTLEHVPRERRLLVVEELRRVGRLAIVVAVPVADWGAPLVERGLYEYVWAVLGGEQVQLREHAEYGLPTIAEARGWLEAPEWACADVPSGLLEDWLAMMLAKHLLLALPDGDATHRALDRRYNQRHGAVDPAEPAYRHVLVCGRGAAAELPGEMTAALGPARRAGDAEDAATALGLLLAAHARRAGADVELSGRVAVDGPALARASAALDRAVASARREVEALRAELARERSRSAELAARVRAYEAGRFVRTMAVLDRARRRVGMSMLRRLSGPEEG